MSEREDFNAWLKTWALPGNTSREDAMYAAWKERGDRTAPSTLQSENERLIQLVATLMKDSETLEGECNAWLAKDAETNRQLAENHNERKALQAEVERLRKDRKSCWEEFKALVKSSREREGELKAENERLREEVERLNKALEVAERSLQNEVNRRNQYAMESDELDRQVEALNNSNKGCEDCFAELMAESKRLVAERDSLKADAERYRHIRENADTMHWENMLKADIETLEDIDAAIDAARTAKPEVDHE